MIGIASAFIAAPLTSLAGCAMLLAGAVVHGIFRARMVRDGKPVDRSVKQG